MSALRGRQAGLATLALALFGVLAWQLALAAPEPLGIDWRLTYRPAALALMSGANPYDPAVAPEAPFFAAPWGLLPLLPFAFLPAEIGRGFIMFGGLLVFAAVAYRLGASPGAMALFLLSPPVVHCIVNANIEWIPLAGLVLPPPVGLFFLAVKPQTGFAVGVFWLFEAWRAGGPRRVLWTFTPVTAALLLSFALYGLWPLRLGSALTFGHAFNASLWPLSIPVGLALLVTAVQRRRVEWAMPASPCLSPYVLFHAWSVAVAALIRQPLQLLVAVASLWVVTLLGLAGP